MTALLDTLLSIDAALSAAIIGVVTPLAVAVIQQSQWSKGARIAAAGLAAVIVGTLTAISSDQITETTEWFQVIAIIYTASEIAYRTLWNKAVAPAIEAGTSRLIGKG